MHEPPSVWAASHDGERETPLPVVEEEEEELEDFSDLLDVSSHGQAVVQIPWRPYGIHLEGSLRESLWFQVHPPHTWSNTGRLDGEADRSFGDLRFHGMLKLDLQNLEDRYRARADVRELYGEYTLRPDDGVRLELSAGKRIVAWGKSDEVRPLDRVCPQDMTAFLYYDRIDRRTGIPGLFAAGSLADRLRVELFWSPYFQASETPTVGDYFEPGALRSFVDAGGRVAGDQENFWTSRAALGGRISTALFRTDLSFYGYRGLDPSPTYKVGQTIHQMPVPEPPYWMPIPPTPVELVPFHPLVTMFGLDLERVAGPFVVRAEAAYLPKGAFSPVRWKQDPSLLVRFPEGLVEKPRFQYVAGLDKMDFLIPRLFLNLQYLGEFIPDFEPYMQGDRTVHGITCTLKYSLFESRLEAIWRLMADLTRGDHQHQVEVSWRFRPHVQMTLGGFFYGGGTEWDLFGQYTSKDFVFTRLHLVF